MKLLESSSSRYDRGIKIITRGKLDKIYLQVAKTIEPNTQVLDIGCGTGSLSLLAAERGAEVKGIDINPEMLDIAKRKAKSLVSVHAVEFVEKGVAELDSEPACFYDTIVSCLCFSELSDDEIRHTLDQITRILKPDGRFILMDELVPKSFIQKILFYLIRVPLLIVTYLLTQTSTRVLSDIDEKIAAVGNLSITHNQDMGSIMTLYCRRNN